MARDVSAALLTAAARHTQPNRRMPRAETPRPRRRHQSGVDVPVSGLLPCSRFSWQHSEQAHLSCMVQR
jgi:hypothetical protein